jgi:hypothetical protein
MAHHKTIETQKKTELKLLQWYSNALPQFKQAKIICSLDCTAIVASFIPSLLTECIANPFN